jgi:hypothetical protein
MIGGGMIDDGPYHHACLTCITVIGYEAYRDVIIIEDWTDLLDIIPSSLPVDDD